MDLSDDDEDSDGSSVVDASFLEEQQFSSTRTGTESPSEKELAEINQSRQSRTPHGGLQVGMGQTVLQWRRQRSQAQNDHFTEEAPSFLIVQENPITSTAVSPTDIWEKSDKQVSVDKATNRVQIDLTPTTNDTDTPAKRSTKIAKIKPPPTGFVDCIAIWDTEKEAYLLEIPTFVAHDPGNTGVAVDARDNETSHDFQKNDPLKRQLQAEVKLRKRKGGTSTSASTSKKSKGRNKK